MPEPKYKKAVERFLGVINYVSRYIPLRQLILLIIKDIRYLAIQLIRRISFIYNHLLHPCPKQLLTVSIPQDLVIQWWVHFRPTLAVTPNNFVKTKCMISVSQLSISCPSFFNALKCFVTLSTALRIATDDSSLNFGLLNKL